MFFNEDFNKNVIYSKLAKISSKINEEIEKPLEKQDRKRECELLYAQMIEGMKLNTLVGNRHFMF